MTSPYNVTCPKCNHKFDIKKPDAPKGHVVGTGWPSFRYGPNGEAKVFNSASEVPKGWEDSPDKVKPQAEKPAEIPLTHEQIVAALRDAGYVPGKKETTAALYARLIELESKNK